MSGDGVSPGASPFLCPYCGEEDLRPEEEAGTWHCRACARVFSLRLLRIDRGGGSGGGSSPWGVPNPATLSERTPRRT